MKEGYVLRLFVAVVIVFFLIGCTSNDSTEKTYIDTNDLTSFHEDKYIDVYILSKSWNTFSVVDELDNKSSKMIVTMANSDDKSVIRKLKKKQKVRIWYDFLRESYPGQTTAYRVEVLE